MSRIVHLGIGAFFRAFGVPWLEEASELSGQDWSVTGVSLRSTSVRDMLRPQDFAYHRMEISPGAARIEKSTALTSVLVAPENPGAVVATMAAKDVHLVTLTVTEKGYCIDQSTGGLDRQHPDVSHDLANPDAPRSAPGLIVAALAVRRAKGQAPFTCLSCDNLPNNGHLLRAAVLGIAREQDPGLAQWIAENGAFPCSMIDRIVPATTPDDLQAFQRATGLQDPGLVVHEPFRQWVIEDQFCAPRPAFEQAGVQVVPKVAPYEDMKLRCLNGTHSTLAYLGLLAGKTVIREAVADRALQGFIQRLWADEIGRSFTPPKDQSTADYTESLMARYENPAIAHQLIQIAMDGSQKIPQRILGPMADLLRAGRDVQGLAIVVAGWMRFIAQGQHPLNDPMADQLRVAARADDPVAAFFGLTQIFPPELVAQPGFRASVGSAFQRLSEGDVQSVLKEYLS